MKTESPPPTTTIPSLLHSLREDTIELISQKVDLAKAEVTESAVELAKRMVAIATAGSLVFAGLLLMLIAGGDLAAVGLVTAGVGVNIAVWLGPLLLGALIAFIGWGMFTKAKNDLSAQKLMPSETVESLKDTNEWAKEKIQSS